jgi:uncharacterized protein (TIGR02646 family)
MMPYVRSEAPDCLSEIEPSIWPLNTACDRETRKRLFEASGDRCAFCDGLMKITSKATIEHFRPKSRFQNLKAVWSNLFPCCDQCQSAKLEKFDEALLKPDEPSYSFQRYFICNFRTGEIEIDPSSMPDEQESAAITLKIYGLNATARSKARLRERRNWLAVVQQNAPNCLAQAELDDWQFRYFLTR